MNGKKRSLQELGVGSLYALLITVTLSTIPIALFVSLQSATTQVNRHVEELTNENLLIHQLDRIVRDISSLGVQLLPKFHPQGLVTLTSGEPLLLAKNPLISPDRISDAVSWVESDFSTSLVAIDFPSSQEIRGCFKFGGRRKIVRQIDSFLALTRDGIYEMKERSPHTTFAASCLTLNLDPQESVIGDSMTSFFHPGTVLIIPIKRINSLYRDSQGTLRLVGHSGESILENQPLRSAMPIMRFRLVQFGSQSSAVQLITPQIDHPVIRYFQLLPPPRLTLIGNS